MRCKLYKLFEKEWSECGIGPFRVLESETKQVSRVVMRRETRGNGPGTKLLLNVALTACKSVALEGEKNIRMTCIEIKEDLSVVGTYLMRLGNSDDAEDLYHEIKKRVL